MLARLIYHSENHLGAKDGKMIASLNSIMSVSNRNNERDGITGALLFDTLWFLQILEGDREMISSTLRRLLTDERHDSVTVMDCQPITHRRFGNWWMGLAFLRGDDAKILSQHGFVRLDPRRMSGDQAINLAESFAQQGLKRQLTM